MRWYKRNLNSYSEYKESFSVGKNNVPNEEKSKQEKAYETAADIRKFEIDKYWSRTGYFWAFIVSIYGAYFAVLTKMYKIEKEHCPPGFLHGEIPLLVLAALGLFFSFSWYLANNASRHWQENWEEHMDLLEDEITGPLYKTYLSDKSYSVSKINILASKVICFCAFCLLQFEFWNFVKGKLRLNGYFAIFLVIVFCLISFFSLFVIARNARGNSKLSGIISFEQRLYGE